MSSAARMNEGEFRLECLRLATQTGSAGRAVVYPAGLVRICALENRLLALVVAGSTKAMKGFAAGAIGLQRVGKNTRSDFCEIVACALAAPLFKLNELCFEVTYALNQRRMLVLHFKHRLLGVDDGIQKLGLPLRKGLSVAQRYHALSDILQSVQRGEGGGDRRHVGHRSGLRRGRLATSTIEGAGPGGKGTRPAPGPAAEPR